MSKVFHKVLLRFGLITVSRARKINATSNWLQSEALAKKAQADFGVGIRVDAKQNSEQWANEVFDKLLGTVDIKPTMVILEKAGITKWLNV